MGKLTLTNALIVKIIRPLRLAEMVCELRKAVAIDHFPVLVAALLANTHVLPSKCFIKHCVFLIVVG